MLKTLALILLAVPLILACAPSSDDSAGSAGSADMAGDDSAAPNLVGDAHSFSRPDEVAISHLGLDLTVDFETKTLSGRASITLDRRQETDRLVLDTRGLDIASVSLDDGEETTFSLGDEDSLLGRPLTVAIGAETEVVHIDYSSRPDAAAVQWLAPSQTSGGQHPFLFTQSQAILARTWIPLQDSPGVRFTYDATIRVPPELMAVMSASNPTELRDDGIYHFRMPQAIPSYLMALAVGDLKFQSLGDQSGVYAEPSVIEAAAWEFADTEKMIDAAEDLYGPYRWGRYDILVLPPSFPFGGMENPRLTFATPTILAGDRSLVALIAHELAHSWSGNLVTNADWNDFWLNEGFTVYFEQRIMEAIYGRDYAEMLAALSLQGLRDEIADMGAESADTHLHLNLAGRDPDDGMTSIAYDKGYFFLRMLEEAAGRERFDQFLSAYFDRHAFESITSTEFIDELKAGLIKPAGLSADDLQIAAWVYGPGLPSNLPTVESDAFGQVEAQIAQWSDGTPAGELTTEGWSTHEWLHFLRNLPEGVTADQLADLDSAFGFTDSGNSEILAAWFMNTIRADYEPAYAALEDFLTRQGRRKFLQPLYEALAKTPAGTDRAKAIYAKARPGYHSVSYNTIDEILGWDAG